jgi:acyl-CoA synthetase (AMP-forming)/AMP-acid ligase II
MDPWPGAVFRSAAQRAVWPMETLWSMARAGFLDPGRLAVGSMVMAQWGATSAGVFVTSARRRPTRPCVVDDQGTLTYGEVDGRTNAMANGLVSVLGQSPKVGLLCRNNRTFVEGHLALTKLGIDAVLMNTGFAPPQLADVCAREGVTALIHDTEGAAVAAGAGLDTLVSAADLEVLTTRYAHHDAARPAREARVVLLTSGTTGVPKGAHRHRPPRDPRLLAAMLSAIPYRADDIVGLEAPAFHAWGFAQYLMATARGATLVLADHFDPAAAVERVTRHHVTFLVVVPTMLQRILDLDDEVLTGADTSSLRVVASSGEALPASLAREWTARFGPTLYNLYGSTEVGHATVATPSDLREAPGTAGRPLPGVEVRIIDDDGRTVPAGEQGRIFVGSPLGFDGYTGGATKDRTSSLLATGDVGHFDARGRLHVSGRSDDMIISGGENVYPREVEDLLLEHDDVVDAAVVGEADDQFGQRLVAFVVPRSGATVEPDELRELVRSRLARHKVPRTVHVVAALPRNATGKVVRTRLNPGSGTVRPERRPRTRRR